MFLKDAQDLFLEQERDRVLTKKILVLQRCIRGWYHRRRFLKMRAAAVVIQKNFRAYNGKKKYQQMRTGEHYKFKLNVAVTSYNLDALPVATAYLTFQDT